MRSYTEPYRCEKTNPSITWWRHQMEIFSALLAFCAGNSPVPVNSPHIGQWREALMFSLIYAWINDWLNNREAGDLRRHRGHCDVNVIYKQIDGLPTSPPLSKIVYVFKGWFVILCYITVKSVWWLLMTWRPNDTRPSAITMITSTVGCALHIRSATSNGSWCIGIKG